MPSTVEADLRQLRLAMAIYHRMDNAIQHEEIYKELTERLREELDYEREAAQMRLYGLMLADRSDGARAGADPRLLHQAAADDDLAGRPAADAPPGRRTRRRKNATASPRRCSVPGTCPFYRYGVIHGDPHLGNYQVRPDGTVNLLDFGAIRVFGAKFVRGVIDLFEAVRDNDDAKAHHAYATWGFTDLSDEKMAVLNLWARFLYEPLIEDRVRRIQETDDPMFGRAVAEQVHAGLKRTGGVKPPREFVLMDRSAIGLGGVFLRLKAELNWSRLFHGLIADFDAAALAAAAGRGAGAGTGAASEVSASSACLELVGVAYGRHSEGAHCSTHKTDPARNASFRSCCIPQQRRGARYLRSVGS